MREAYSRVSKYDAKGREKVTESVVGSDTQVEEPYDDYSAVQILFFRLFFHGVQFNAHWIHFGNSTESNVLNVSHNIV